MARTAKGILEQEALILKHVIENPGAYKLSTLANRLGIPRTTLKGRIAHLRAAGYLKKTVVAFWATDDGRVAYAYYNRTNG